MLSRKLFATGVHDEPTPLINRAAACDVAGGVASLHFDATELQIFKGNLGSPSNPNLSKLRLTIDFNKKLASP